MPLVPAAPAMLPAMTDPIVVTLVTVALIVGSAFFVIIEFALAEATLTTARLAAEQLTRIASTLNDLITARLIELECKAAGIGSDEGPLG